MLFFRKAAYNFAEHLTLAAFTSGERAVFYCLVLAPIWILFPAIYYPMLIVYLVLWFLYYALACMQLFEGNRVWSFTKGLLVSIAVQVISMAIITTLILLVQR